MEFDVDGRRVTGAGPDDEPSFGKWFFPCLRFGFDLFWVFYDVWRLHMISKPSVVDFAAEVHQFEVACEEIGSVVAVEEHVGKTALVEKTYHELFRAPIRSHMDEGVFGERLLEQCCEQLRELLANQSQEFISGFDWTGFRRSHEGLLWPVVLAHYNDQSAFMQDEVFLEDNLAFF